MHVADLTLIITELVFIIKRTVQSQIATTCFTAFIYSIKFAYFLTRRLLNVFKSRFETFLFSRIQN